MSEKKAKEERREELPKDRKIEIIVRADNQMRLTSDFNPSDTVWAFLKAILFLISQEPQAKPSPIIKPGPFGFDPTKFRHN